MGKVYSINTSDKKGVAKSGVDKAVLIEGFGVAGDAHGSAGDRQVSLLAIESIRKQKDCVKVSRVPQNGHEYSESGPLRERGADFTLGPGDFAENITTEGIDLSSLRLGDTLRIGDRIVLKISKIGKECHRFCSIYYKTGDCIMPREGIFAEVITGGEIRRGDTIERGHA